MKVRIYLRKKAIFLLAHLQEPVNLLIFHANNTDDQQYLS